jgi:hypothetical protein
LLALAGCSPAGDPTRPPSDDRMGAGPGDDLIFTDDETLMGDFGVAPGLRDACASAAYESELLPASVLLVVDRSGTMVCNPPPITANEACEATPVTADPGRPTKWAILADGVGGAVEGMTGTPNLQLGVTFFSNNDECGVQAAPNIALGPLGGAQVSAIRSGLAQIEPRGGTPMVGAAILAYRHLHQDLKALGNRFVVLLTDGVDNCEERYADLGVATEAFELLEAEMQKALGVNIRTFIVGTPGSGDARGLLSHMAWLGGTVRDPGCDHTSANPSPGTECHFDMTRTTDFAADLASAMQRIAGRSAMTCEFDVPTAPDGVTLDTGAVNVDYLPGGSTDPADRVLLYRDDSLPCDEGADGWQYLDGSSKIRLCGPTCEGVRADATAHVIVSVGCAQRIR